MKYIFTITVLLTTLLSWGQEDAWVYFTDKPDAAYYLANPLEMLTERALARRDTHGIALDEIDVPISDTYVSQIEAATGITVLAKSKWLNAVHVQGAISSIGNLSSLDFVSEIVYANSSIGSSLMAIPESEHEPVNKWQNLSTLTDFEYGIAQNQITMLNANFLHENDFTGEGMLIAVIDSGFDSVNTMDAFARIRNNGQILGTYNFVTGAEDVYLDHYHGTMVLSTIAGYVEGEFVGTAPDADFYLFVSENAAIEVVLEESLWVEAAEEADRLGVDVINTSLGYSNFDNPNHSHTYADMDGNTTFISKGAEIACSRGIIVVNSAGNSGSSEWHYITAPADATSVLTIGAVYDNEVITDFSSWGPSADGRVKPDVCAQGGGAAIIPPSGDLTYGNGTSFSSPIMCGAVTCFWQAFPDLTGEQIRQAIKASSDRFSFPDDQYGYGIPDFEAAYTTTVGVADINNVDFELSIYPNPNTSDVLYINRPNTDEKMTISIVDVTGKIVLQTSSQLNNTPIDISNLERGIYILQLDSKEHQIGRKLVIQ